MKGIRDLAFFLVVVVAKVDADSCANDANLRVYSYKGCYDSSNMDRYRVGGYLDADNKDGYSLLQCSNHAQFKIANQLTDHFGMEYPQGSPDGQAQCWYRLTGTIVDSSLRLVSDIDCQVDYDNQNGGRLGGAYRVAVYEMKDKYCYSKQNSHKLCGCGECVHLLCVRACVCDLSLTKLSNDHPYTQKIHAHMYISRTHTFLDSFCLSAHVPQGPPNVGSKPDAVASPDAGKTTAVGLVQAT